jgi:hypothetical protein
MKRAIVSLLLLLFVLCTLSLGQDPGSAAKNLPQIVGRFKRTRQTDPIQGTVVFTPKSTGLFRISGNLLITTPGGSGRWILNFSWTGSRREALDIATRPSNDVGSPEVSGPWVFPAQAGQPVKISVKSDGDVGGSVYDAFYVIERLTKIPSF